MIMFGRIFETRLSSALKAFEKAKANVIKIVDQNNKAIDKLDKEMELLAGYRNGYMAESLKAGKVLNNIDRLLGNVSND